MSFERRLLLSLTIPLALIGVTTAYAAQGSRPSYCSSFFFTPRVAVAKWGKAKYASSKSWMEKLFLSEDGKMKGVTKAAAQDPRGEYKKIWIRDNGINVKEVMDNPEIAEAYVDFCLGNIRKNMLGDLGEAVLWADGKIHREWWGRPQNDGPGYVVLRLSEIAEASLKRGLNAKLVRRIYAHDLGTPSMKSYLEYIAHNWRKASFDLWEEETGAHFHTLVVMLDALEKGAALAARLEPGGAASEAVRMYLSEAKAMRAAIRERAWDGQRGHLLATWQTDFTKNGVILNNGDVFKGFVHKQSPLDVGSIIGLLHTSTNPPIYTLADDRVMATMAKLEERFSASYRFNERFADPRYRGIAALGRYEEDVFHGGNPWVITTQAGAEYYYRLAGELLDLDEIVITPTNEAFFRRMMGGNEDFRAGRHIPKSSKEFLEIIAAAEEKAEGFLAIVRTIPGDDGFHAEQFGRGYRPGDQGPWVEKYLAYLREIAREQSWRIDPKTVEGDRTIDGGNWLGAELLVWNEASFRSAWRARSDLQAKLRSIRR